VDVQREVVGGSFLWSQRSRGRCVRQGAGLRAVEGFGGVVNASRARRDGERRRGSGDGFVLSEPDWRQVGEERCDASVAGAGEGGRA
jgi:hypothetical protein